MPVSTSPADPANWLRDVHRANTEALASWERILDRLEHLLSESTDAAPSELRSGIPRWSAALQAAVEASAHLESGLRLANARYEDARAAGLVIRKDRNIHDRASEAGHRTALLTAELRSRMAVLAADIDSRHARRPRTRIFHNEAPTLFDLHV